MDESNVVLCQYESSDDKLAARTRLLERWFRNHQTDKIFRIMGYLPDDYDEELVCLIVNKNNPDATRIKEAFRKILRAMSMPK
jgi:hypothetical protein